MLSVVIMANCRIIIVIKTVTWHAQTAK